MNDAALSTEVLTTLYREDFYAFLAKAFETLHPGQVLGDHWYLEAICFQLEAVVRGHETRLVITMPPRHLKSITVSVALIAWILGLDPGRKCMVVSYGDDLAEKHGTDCRTIMESDWYKACFPGTRLSRRVATDLVTTKNGGRRGVGAAGALTGHGADLMVIDDFMKAQDANSPTAREAARNYYEHALYSRLNDKERSPIIATQQRLAEDDLPGYLLAKGTFQHINLPAKAIQEQVFPLYGGRSHTRRVGDLLRESQESLDNTLLEMGAPVFSAQYQQEPVPPGGNRFRWEWFQTYEAAPEREDLLKLVQSWDTASEVEPNSSWSVCTVWGLRKDGVWLLLDVDRNRFYYPDLKSRALYLHQEWAADYILVEHASTGLALLRELRREIRRGDVLAVRAIQDKVSRLDVETAKIAAGKVLRPADAPWLQDFRRELAAFPRGQFDDQVDSMTQFLRWTGSRQGHGIVSNVVPEQRSVRRAAIRRNPVRR